VNFAVSVPIAANLSGTHKKVQVKLSHIVPQHFPCRTLLGQALRNPAICVTSVFNFLATDISAGARAFLHYETMFVRSRGVMREQ
jgi:hypothetical protein